VSQSYCSSDANALGGLDLLRSVDARRPHFSDRRANAHARQVARNPCSLENNNCSRAGKVQGTKQWLLELERAFCPSELDGITRKAGGRFVADAPLQLDGVDGAPKHRRHCRAHGAVLAFTDELSLRTRTSASAQAWKILPLPRDAEWHKSRVERIRYQRRSERLLFTTRSAP
jgi:hypothetical protein